MSDTTIQLYALDVYIMTDQPEVCPKCGDRTQFIEVDDNRQQHQCTSCNYQYFLDNE